jgi:hypothetical protein
MNEWMSECICVECLMDGHHPQPTDLEQHPQRGDWGGAVCRPGTAGLSYSLPSHSETSAWRVVTG